MQKGFLEHLKSYSLFLFTALDLMVSGVIAIFIAIFKWDFRKPLYDWARSWSERTRKRFGITYRLVGSENLPKEGGYLYLANHQSMVEVVLLPIFMPDHLLFIGKKTIKWIPVFGLLWILSKQVFLDRYHHEKALKGMELAKRRLKEGFSIFLAPEGTRSKTGGLGTIKKGFFHLALQTQAPIVPITFVNAYNIQPKHSFFITPGEVLIIIDPPIDTSQWKPGEVEFRREELRRVYQRNLNRYGSPGQRAPLEPPVYVADSKLQR